MTNFTSPAILRRACASTCRQGVPLLRAKIRRHSFFARNRPYRVEGLWISFVT